MSIIVKSSVAALLSAIVSVAIGSLVLGGPNWLPKGIALFMCIACPIVIAWPATAWLLWQKQKLRIALDAAERAHARLMEAHRALAEKARHDDMTGMLNREAFFEEVEAARRGLDTGTLLIIDADNFKAINDRFGHLTGDVALLEISAAICRAVRERDIVGRIGGEEFGVFLPGADRCESLRVAERLRSEVAAADFRPTGEVRMSLSVSVGGVMHRRSSKLSELLREADRRLYEAKRRGRNQVIFTQAPAAAA
jgi:diguanylate cyclase (GGDEF)-like protein